MSDRPFRLFVALDLPADARELLAAWGREAARALGAARHARATDAHGEPAIRPLDASSLHLTLAFLGARAGHDVDPLVAAVGALDVRTGTMSLGPPRWLPRRRPRALAIEVREGSGWLAALRDDVATAMSAAADWEPERRRWHPHVTVARLSGGGAGRGARARRASGGRPEPDGLLPPSPDLTLAPGGVTLYRSWLDPHGARYEALASTPAA